MIHRVAWRGIFFIAIILLVVAASSAQTPGVPWPATDGLGRQLPDEQEVGPPKPGKFVGIFYFLWHNDPRVGPPGGSGPYDVSKILARDPNAAAKGDSPPWGPIGMAHYWGEPLYGYYQATDPWVLRRHAKLLADAGIDTLIFDATNAQTYSKVHQALCEVFEQVRREGGRTPQIAFMVNTQARATAQRLYDDLYKPGHFRDLWFVWRGKPLLLCDPKQASPELRKFFTLRAAHWPFTLVNTPYAWHWEATYPQPYGYTDDPAKPEEVNVSVAQNLRASDGVVTNMSNGDARGRSFHNGAEDRSAGAIDHGFNFQEQWKRALELNPPFVMVTGWNEWIAGRFGEPGKPVVFVDQYTEEFSRDIEPMKGGHGDNYYYQLVANVRRYKGMPALPRASPPVTMDMSGGFDAWRGVAPDFAEPASSTAPRDFDGIGGLRYSDHTGRNNLVDCKVARDEKYVYFYARTRDPLTPRTDPAWMWLLISTGRPAAPNWEGYDFILNRSPAGDGLATLERCAGGWKWTKAAQAPFRYEGKEIQVAIRRSALGIPEGGKVSLNFKWADNLQRPGDIMDFYLSGNVAPAGRFMYRFQAE